MVSKIMQLVEVDASNITVKHGSMQLSLISPPQYSNGEKLFVHIFNSTANGAPLCIGQYVAFHEVYNALAAVAYRSAGYKVAVDKQADVKDGDIFVAARRVTEIFKNQSNRPITDLAMAVRMFREIGEAIEELERVSK